MRRERVPKVSYHRHPLLNPYLLFFGWLLVLVFSATSIGVSNAAFTWGTIGVFVLLFHTQYVTRGPNALPRWMEWLAVTLATFVAMAWMFSVLGKLMPLLFP